MTGMKEGAGEDPFANNSDSDDHETTTESETTNMSETTTQPTQIPMILRRNSVQDGRDRVPLFLQEGTKRDERNGLVELENRLDHDVALTDLREAVMLVGLQHLDEVEQQLEDWGYGITFED